MNSPQPDVRIEVTVSGGSGVGTAGVEMEVIGHHETTFFYKIKEKIIPTQCLRMKN
jgi:hypothetical protein